MRSGERDRLITVQRATVTTDDYGGETSAWADLEQAWARVRFGTAQEKREAAQERFVQSATFEVVPTAALLSADATTRILLHEDASYWDNQGPGERLDRNTLRFTAVRSV